VLGQAVEDAGGSKDGSVVHARTSDSPQMGRQQIEVHHPRLGVHQCTDSVKDIHDGYAGSVTDSMSVAAQDDGDALYSGLCGWLHEHSRVDVV